MNVALRREARGLGRVGSGGRTVAMAAVWTSLPGCEADDRERLADAIERLVDCWELATLLPEPVASASSTNS